MNRMFQESMRSFGPSNRGAANSNFPRDYDFHLKETDQGYVIEFDISGLDKEKLDIQINSQSITLSGQYSDKTEEINPYGYYSSKSFGTFLKTIPLPVDADIGKIKTDKQGDVLVIKMPKKA
jgi:HSP20 family protein